MSRVIFSNNLYNFQVAFDLDNYKMAEKINVSPQRMNNWLTGQVYPQVDVIIQICDFFQFKDLYRLISEKIPPGEIRAHAEIVRNLQEA